MPNAHDQTKKTSFLNKLFKIFGKNKKSGKLESKAKQNLKFGEAFEEYNENVNTKSHGGSSEEQCMTPLQRDVDIKMIFGDTDNCEIVTKNICDKQNFSDNNITTYGNAIQSSKKTSDPHADNICMHMSNMQRDRKAYSATNINIEQDEKELKCGSDRNLNKKIAFLKDDHAIKNVHPLNKPDSLNYSGSFANISNLISSNDTDFLKIPKFVSYSNTMHSLKETHKFLSKEINISQENSEDSDFSAESTEDSFEESSEDENELLIDYEKNEKSLKDEYFTKGKYITYFFLEMERQFYNPFEVYSMVHYHESSNTEKPGKEGII